MPEDRFTSPPKPAITGIQESLPLANPSSPSPPAAPPLTWQLILANLAVQCALALFVGVVTLIVLNAMGSEGSAALGGAVVAAIIGLWAARSLVHWPIPKTTLKAQGQLPPNIRPAETGGREVVETIVFVVVLVLLLKSFAAEAFVIPTGSMAETLFGYQKIVTCPSCEYEFPVNCSSEVDPQDQPMAVINGCACPNCRQSIRLVSPNWRQPREGRHPAGYVEVRDPGATSGDRVLVGKFLYDSSIRGATPDRLDVVVFKYPEGPQKNHVAMNYIKRLIGLPGETIAISGGDLYVLRPGKSPVYDDSHVNPTKLWEPPYMHADDEAAREKWKAEQFEIVRKPPRVLLSMMRIVCDNSRPASDLKEKLWQRWRPEGEAWEELQGGKAFRHGGGAGEGWLRYKHILRSLGGKPSLITDFMGYNSGQTIATSDLDWAHHGPLADANGNGVNWVGDLVLECEVKVEKAEGELVLELVRSGERYQARWELENGRCTLSSGVKGDEKKLDSKPTRLGKGTYKVRLANVDQRLTVWVDGTLPFEDGVTYTPPAEKGPKRADLEPASVGVKGTAVTVSKIKLFRDDYFTRGDPNPNAADVPIEDPTDPARWDNLRDPGVKTLYVQPGHFLCLGDNSPASSDGRKWGLVPERLLLGRALLVYYPFSRAGRIR